MLDDLLDAIALVNLRIQNHRQDLQANETRTRVALIDPLLKALGWDTSDPRIVTPEYDVSGKRADYALLGDDGTPIIFLEAKKLGEPLSNNRSQILAYASELGIKYPALTNGNEWEVYDNSQFVPVEDRRILNVSVTSDPPSKCALELLLLWRSNLVSGRHTEASIPIFRGTTEGPNDTGPEVPPNGWVPLGVFHPSSGSKPPRRIGFPDGEKREIQFWKSVLTEVAEWLIRIGALTSEKCPITAGQNSAHSSVNVQPRHPNGTDFFTPHTLSNGLFLAPHGNAKSLIDRSKALIEHLGQDPSRIILEASSPN